MRKWTDALPERLQTEVEAFDITEGLDFALAQAELATPGLPVFRGPLSMPGRAPTAREVRYPASFPYPRPEVFAPELRFGRPQTPYRRNLCLLERSTRQW